MPRAKNEYIIQIFDDENSYCSFEWLDTRWTNAYLKDVEHSENVFVNSQTEIVPVSKSKAKKVLEWMRKEYPVFACNNSYMIVKIPVDKKVTV